MSDRKSINIASDLFKQVQEAAAEQGCEIGEAAARLLKMGFSRRAALAKYAGKSGSAPRAPRVAREKPVKKKGARKKSGRRASKKSKAGTAPLAESAGAAGAPGAEPSVADDDFN